MKLVKADAELHLCRKDGRLLKPFSCVPRATKDMWVEAQNMFASGQGKSIQTHGNTTVMAGRRVWDQELPNVYQDHHGGKSVNSQPNPAECKMTGTHARMHARTHACMHAELRTLGWIKKFVQFYKNPSTAAEMTWESVRDWCTAFHVFTDVPEEVRERLRGVYVLKQCSCKTFRHYYICAHVLLYAMVKLELGPAGAGSAGFGLVPNGWQIGDVGQTRRGAPEKGRDRWGQKRASAAMQNFDNEEPATKKSRRR